MTASEIEEPSMVPEERLVPADRPVSGIVPAKARAGGLASGLLVSSAGAALAWGVFELSNPGIPWGLRLVIAASLSALGLAGFVAAHGDDERAFRLRFSRGVQGLGPTLAVISLLPFAPRLVGSAPALGVAALAIAATLIHSLRERRALARSRDWPLTTLALTLFGVVTYVAVGRGLTGSTNNDAAYYYGVARHIATTLRYEEPIVWQFLDRPKHVVHAPFDYWHGLASLSLVPVLRVFGTGFGVVGTFMALVSSATLLLFWYVISVRARVDGAWVQVTSVVLFAFSPALLAYRFDSETIPFAHLAFVASLAALATGRRVLGAVFAFLMFVCRADTLGTAAVVIVFSFLAEARHGARRGLRVAAASLAMTAVYCGYHLAVFRSLSPPAARHVPFIVDGLDLYRWRLHPRPLRPLSDLLDTSYVDGRASVAADTFTRADFFPHALFWLALGAGAWLRRRPSLRGVDGVASVAAIGGAFLVSWSATPVFAFWRSLHPLVPALVLAGAYGACAWMHRLGSALPRSRAHRVTAPLACLLAIGMVYTIRPYAAAPGPSPSVANVRRASPWFGKEGSVMAVSPWFVLAYTDRPAVNVPVDGEAAIVRAIETYDVRTLFLVDSEACADQSRALCVDLVSGKKTKIGRHRVEKVSRLSGLTVLRILGR